MAFAFTASSYPLAGATPGAVASARSSLDAEGAALARVLESVREQRGIATRLHGAEYWRGDAQRRFSASVADLAAVLARACLALESAIDGAGRAAAMLAVAEQELRAAEVAAAEAGHGRR